MAIKQKIIIYKSYVLNMLFRVTIKKNQTNSMFKFDKAINYNISI